MNAGISPFTRKRAVKILFLSFTCKENGVPMVTNMISQLQKSFLLRHAASSFEISFKNMEISSVSIKYKNHYMAARGYEFCLRIPARISSTYRALMARL